MFWGCFPKINTRLFSLNNDDGNVFILNVFNLIGKTVDSSWGRGNRFGLNAVISCDCIKQHHFSQRNPVCRLYGFRSDLGHQTLYEKARKNAYLQMIQHVIHKLAHDPDDDQTR